MDEFIENRIRLLVEFYETEAQRSQSKFDTESASLMLEVERLVEENLSLKNQIATLSNHTVIHTKGAPISGEVIVRQRPSPSKVPRNSNKSPEEAENSEPHANALPTQKRVKVQTAAKTSITNTRSTRTRSKNT